MRSSMLLVLTLVMSGCGSSPLGQNQPQAQNTARVILVFVDESLSTDEDRAVYTMSLERISGDLRPGERLLIGPITARSSADFRASVDESLPAPIAEKTLMDNELDYKHRKDAFDEKIRSSKQRISDSLKNFQQKQFHAQHTAILESLRVAEQVFSAEKRHGVLVFLSDMLEESSLANFEKTFPTDAYITRLLEHLRSSSLIPNLRSVDVYVAGAGAPSPEHAAGVEHFWRRFFEAAGCPLKPGRYGRTLVTFGE